MTPTNTVRGFMEQYEHGSIDFPTLLSLMAAHVPASPPRPRDWGELWDRAEQVPDDNDPFWVTVAGDLGVLAEEQEEQIFAAIEGFGIGPS